MPNTGERAIFAAEASFSSLRQPPEVRIAPSSARLLMRCTADSMTAGRARYSADSAIAPSTSSTLPSSAARRSPSTTPHISTASSDQAHSARPKLTYSAAANSSVSGSVTSSRLLPWVIDTRAQASPTMTKA